MSVCVFVIRLTPSCSNTACIEKNAALQCTATNLWSSVKTAHSTSSVAEVLVSSVLSMRRVARSFHFLISSLALFLPA